MKEQQFLQDLNNIQQYDDPNLIKEKLIDAKGGCTICCYFLLLLLCVGIINIIIAALFGGIILLIIGPCLGFLTFIAFFFMVIGFFTNDVNIAHVLTFFGTYYGTVKKNGFLWVNPLTSKKRISLKAQNLNGAVIKVNDKHGNPVMMGCVVVWRIFDTAKATFEVDSCENYIRIQSEGVVREVGCLFPYDKLSKEDTITLKGDQKEIKRILVELMTKRCMPAGIEIPFFVLNLHDFINIYIPFKIYISSDNSSLLKKNF